MPCRKSYEKLWNNYLMKYGDFRERLQIIRNDHQCFMQFQLPRLKQQSSNVHVQSTSTVKKPLVNGSNRILHKKCDPLLPSECCHSSITKNNRSFVLNKTDLDKIIEAENFPDNIFPIDIESRPSIDNETELSVSNNIHQLSSRRLTSPLNSIFSKNDFSHSITKNDEGSSVHRSMQKSELAVNSHDPTTNRITNPYANLIERLRKTEKSKLEKPDTKIDHKSFDSTIDANIHIRIQKLLSFLHSLDDTTDNQQNSNTFDENTLIALFSVDNHLSSSIYVPTNIQQLNIVPKSILHSLKNTSDNEHILNRIQAELLRNKIKELNPSNDDSQISNYVDQDNELNSKLSNTYTIKAFKDFLIHHNKSTRLPKLFHDIDQLDQT